MLLHLLRLQATFAAIMDAGPDEERDGDRHTSNNPAGAQSV
jgi:hypothetical protein